MTWHGGECLAGEDFDASTEGRAGHQRRAAGKRGLRGERRYLQGSLESVPTVAAKWKEPNPQERKFEDVVKDAEQAAVLVD